MRLCLPGGLMQGGRTRGQAGEHLNDFLAIFNRRLDLPLRQAGSCAPDSVAQTF